MAGPPTPLRPPMRLHRHAPAAALLAVVLGVPALTFPASAAPTQSRSQAQPVAVRDVRLEARADAPRKTLLLRGGRIEGVLDATAPLPPAVRVIEGKGQLALPTFIDAYTQAGTTAPVVKPDRDVPVSTRSDVQVDMREAGRKGITPAYRASENFDLPNDKSKPFRESGFGWLVSAPSGELLSGSSVLATSREAAARDQIVQGIAFAHGDFRASGPGYPGTPMGFVAQLRQFFLDAARQRELELRFSQARPGPRPPFDADLAAARPLLLHERRLMCAADSDLAIERWLRLADEQGLDIGITGGRAAHEVASLLAARKIPVVLTLEWGEEPKDPREKKDAGKAPEGSAQKAPDSGAGAAAESRPAPAGDPPQEKPAEPAAPGASEKPASDAPAADPKQWEYEEPLAVREEKRLEWEKGRDCAMKLAAAGVPFAFGSASASPSELLKRVRTLVEKGLGREAALEALCLTPARWLGLDGRVGAVAPGKDATFTLWTGDPLDPAVKDAQVAWIFVDGFAHEFEIKPKQAPGGKPKEGLSAAGRYEVTTEGRQGKRTSQLVLEMTADGDVSGKWTSKSPRDDSEQVSDASGHLSGTTLTLEVKFSFGEREFTQKLTGELTADAWSGELTAARPGGESTSPFTATRKPQQEELR